jgi:hypothetical protein
MPVLSVKTRGGRLERTQLRTTDTNRLVPLRSVSLLSESPSATALTSPPSVPAKPDRVNAGWYTLDARAEWAASSSPGSVRRMRPEMKEEGGGRGGAWWRAAAQHGRLYVDRNAHLGDGGVDPRRAELRRTAALGR